MKSLMFFEIIKLGLYLFWKLFEITIHQFDDKWNHYAGFIYLTLGKHLKQNWV